MTKGIVGTHTAIAGVLCIPIAVYVELSLLEMRSGHMEHNFRCLIGPPQQGFDVIGNAKHDNMRMQKSGCAQVSSAGSEKEAACSV